MREELLASFLFALERVIRDLVNRAIKNIKDKRRAEKFSKDVHQFRFGETDQEKDDAAIGMESKFKQRSE